MGYPILLHTYTRTHACTRAHTDTHTHTQSVALLFLKLKEIIKLNDLDFIIRHFVAHNNDT